MIKQEDNEKWVVVQGRSKLFEGGMAKAFGGGKHIHRSGGMHPQDNLDTRKSLLRQFYGQKYLQFSHGKYDFTSCDTSTL